VHSNPSGTGNPVSDYVDFIHWLPSYPFVGTTTLSGLGQYKSDAITPISLGATTTQSVVVFKATLQSLVTSTESLQVEVKPADVAFTNTLTVSSTFVTPGNNATATYPLVDLRETSSSNGSFHWQARVVDKLNNSSSWQLAGLNTSSTDFQIRTVPQYTQQTSTFPSLSNTTGTGLWATHSYDNRLATCGTGVNSSTIMACGCTITSVVMDLRYLKITTNVSNTDVNPLTLNNWLASTSQGYQNGDLNWSKVPLYAKTSGGQFTISSTVITATGTPNTLSSTLNSYLSLSTPIPVILYEPNAPNGTSTTTHFVVATGFANNKGTSTYALRDPLWYNTQYLNQATGSTWTNNYSNDYRGVDVLLPMPGFGGFSFLSPESNSSANTLLATAPLYVQYSIALPDGLLLTDASGRRTGEDPVTGAMYNEIPDASYVEQQHSWQLHFPQPVAGRYTIQIIGKHNGQYGLETDIFDGQNSLPTPRYSGSIKIGQVITYAQNYDPNNLASSTVVHQ